MILIFPLMTLLIANSPSKYFQDSKYIVYIFNPVNKKWYIELKYPKFSITE